MPARYSAQELSAAIQPFVLPYAVSVASSAPVTQVARIVVVPDRLTVDVYTPERIDDPDLGALWTPVEATIELVEPGSDWAWSQRVRIQGQGDGLVPAEIVSAIAAEMEPGLVREHLESLISYGDEDDGGFFEAAKRTLSVYAAAPLG